MGCVVTWLGLALVSLRMVLGVLLDSGTVHLGGGLGYRQDAVSSNPSLLAFPVCLGYDLVAVAPVFAGRSRRVASECLLVKG